jgi:imidazole glycerol-phosphate synthase subunit HisH
VIAVVDYKAGNLTSVFKALDSLGVEARLTEDPAEVRRASKIMLPGVGHFAATRTLSEAGLTEAIRERIAEGVPFLGICVGLQWLFAGSEESPETPGLGAFAGACERFPAGALKCPHVGWNALEITRPSALTEGLESGAHVYYTHSFRAPVVQETAAVTHYGAPFTAIVSRGNLHGVQFHPEKSGEAGLRLLANFVRL